MKAKTELLLYTLSWHADGIFRPGFRSRAAPFENAVYPDGLERQIHRLQEKAFIEAVGGKEPRDRAYRLTELGRSAARGGVDPVKRWQRAWDGLWRLVAFDLPSSENSARETWRRELRRQRFGCLQGSLWVSPDPVDGIKHALENVTVRAKRLLFIEGRPAAGETDAEIVHAAWSFDRINRLYVEQRRILEALPAADLEKSELRTRLAAWAKREHTAWREIVRHDPFLPQALLPPGYTGPRVWELREVTLRRAGLLAGKG